MTWKDTLLSVAAEVWGTFKPAATKKVTQWWTSDIGILVKEKKKVWMKYLELGTPESFEVCRKQRDIVKKAVQAAKKVMWEKFGEKMEENYRENQKLLYRVLKSMRKQKECPLKYIYDKKQNLLTEPKKIMEKWKEYFQELLETKAQEEEKGNDKEQEQDDALNGKEGEDNTRGELQKAIKKDKNGEGSRTR